jgi:hypothetical protein
LSTAVDIVLPFILDLKCIIIHITQRKVQKRWKSVLKEVANRNSKKPGFFQVRVRQDQPATSQHWLSWLHNKIQVLEESLPGMWLYTSGQISSQTSDGTSLYPA